MIAWVHFLIGRLGWMGKAISQTALSIHHKLGCSFYKDTSCTFYERGLGRYSKDR
jgi:hypothetical protein